MSAPNFGGICWLHFRVNPDDGGIVFLHKFEARHKTALSAGVLYKKYFINLLSYRASNFFILTTCTLRDYDLIRSGRKNSKQVFRRFHWIFSFFALQKTKVIPLSSVYTVCASAPFHNIIVLFILYLCTVYNMISLVHLFLKSYGLSEK